MSKIIGVTVGTPLNPEKYKNGLPAATEEDNDKVLTVVGGEPQWALHAGISNKQKVVFADDGEGNVSIVLVEGEEDQDELENRVTTVETALFGGANTDPEPEPTVETVSVTNLFTNPHFDDGLDEWTYQYDKCVREVVDGELYLHDFYGSADIMQVIGPATDVGHRYYLYSRFKGEGNPSKLQMTLLASDIVLVDTEQSDPVIGDWSYMSVATTIDSKVDGSKTKFRLMVNFTSSAHYAGTEVRIDDLVAIDLTDAFGAGNEPTFSEMNAWMLEQYPNGFTGTVDLALTREDEDAPEEDVVVNGGLVEQVKVLEDRVKSLAAGSTTQTGTAYPVLHDYYIANIEEARPAYYNAQEPGALTFTMMSDVHIYDNGAYPTISGYENIAKNVEAASAWSKLVNNDFIMISGDLLEDKHDKPKALSMIDDVLELSEKHARCPVYVLKGNHDTNDESGESVPENRLSDKDFYIHANARSEKYGMVVDPAHPYSGYYYVDFPKHKIRMICLNTSEDNPNYDILTASKGDFRYIGVFSPNQTKWIEDVALRVDDGWAVMMFSHIPPFRGENFEKRGTDNPALRSLCEAFAAGAGSFVEQGAREFIGHFSGHAHVDAYNEVGGLNYVLVNSTIPRRRGDDTENTTYLDRDTEAAYLSLNSFIVDRANRTVKCIKIGAAPADDYNGWKDSFTWSEVSV